MVKLSETTVIEIDTQELLSARVEQFGGDGYGDIILTLASTGNGREETFSVTYLDLKALTDLLNFAVQHIEEKRNR